METTLLESQINANVSIEMIKDATNTIMREARFKKVSYLTTTVFEVFHLEKFGEKIHCFLKNEHGELVPDDRPININAYFPALRVAGTKTRKCYGHLMVLREMYADGRRTMEIVQMYKDSPICFFSDKATISKKGLNCLRMQKQCSPLYKRMLTRIRVQVSITAKKLHLCLMPARKAS